jgi:hypothetical protein
VKEIMSMLRNRGGQIKGEGNGECGKKSVVKHADECVVIICVLLV